MPGAMPYSALEARLRAAAAHGFRAEEHARVVEGGATFALLRLTLPGRRGPLLITSGFHGEEPAGPLALAAHAAGIAAAARARDVALTIYPCANPSGFEDGTRYNRSSERPNNDFLRYEGAPGSDWRVFRHGPQETRALRAALEAEPTPAAALDLHQDASVRGPAVYAYVFGDRAPFRRLLEESARLAPILRGGKVYGNTTDAEGLIEDHDGSVSDWMLRRGARRVAALETSTDTPLEAAMAIALVWVRGFIELAAEAEIGAPPTR